MCNYFPSFNNFNVQGTDGRFIFLTFASMNNPFRILRLLKRVVRPSRADDMVAVRDGFWLKHGYAALTFFGYVVTRTQAEADRLNRHYDELKNHEMIHLRQAQSCHDSWLLFYARYLWYYVRALPYNRKLKNAAYLLNPFEMEAYAHMSDLAYADRCRHEGATEWRRYARLPVSRRMELKATHQGVNSQDFARKLKIISEKH